MKGILIASHGEMAKGMYDSATLFFGTSIKQCDYICLRAQDNIDLFEEKMGDKIENLNTGDGVLVFVDLYGGTPAHKTTSFIKHQVQVIAGMNLPMLIEALSSRMSEAAFEESSLLNIGKSGIRIWNPYEEQKEDDFFSE